MTDRAQKLYEDAMTLTDEERWNLGEQLMASVADDEEWLAELTRRARRAHEDPSGGEPWDVVKQRIKARVAMP